jgi:hypothetical protein
MHPQGGALEIQLATALAHAQGIMAGGGAGRLRVRIGWVIEERVGCGGTRQEKGRENVDLHCCERRSLHARKESPEVAIDTRSFLPLRKRPPGSRTQRR